MNYKETLFFVGKCLTITHEDHNKTIVEKEIKSGNVDWDNVVKLSTAHYVFPALYCNLKRANFLEYLPEELVNYMKHITDLNRERNQQIIIQAKEINELLLANNITPIFLKGTGNLLEGLYEDIAERMVGDIDFIVSKDEYQKTISLFKKSGYENKIHILDNLKLGKHYPRLSNPKKIMAIEIHFKVIRDNYNKGLNFQTLIINSIKLDNKTSVLNKNYQLIHTVFNKQINDFGYWHKTVSLRNTYDVYLLSYLTDTLHTFNVYKNYFKISNGFLASVSFFLNSKKIKFERNPETNKFIKKQIKLIDNPKKMKWNKKKWDFYFNNKSRLRKLKISFQTKEMRIHFINLLKSNS